VKIRALAAAVLVVLAGLGLALSATIASAASTTSLTLGHGRCAYWTTNRGVAAVAVTSGVNCLSTHAFTLNGPPYNGATFENYNAFLSQVGEKVNGPGGIGGGPFKLVGSAKNVYTNHVAVYVYQGPGNNDGSAESMNFLIHGGYPWGPA
jgi:hypothetical protein